MNTVGKPGRLGEPVRCVVSVAMLTEGWDANTVTHILGIRAFRSQLLCEQVVGRGLRRRSYAINDQGRFDAEYASVYGVPFAFIPSDKPPIDPKPAPPATEVRSVPGREHLRITFPHVEAYRLEIPDEYLYLDADRAPRYRVGASTVPTWTLNAPIVGEVERIEEESGALRPQAVAFRLARRLLRHEYVIGSDERPWLFPRLVQICKEWLDQCVDLDEGFDVGTIVRYAEFEADAAEAIYHAVTCVQDDRRKRMRVILRRADPVGSTESVSFVTRKPNLTTTLSEVSHVVLDGPGGNTWEEKVATLCEEARLPVAAYVKNDHLGFAIPYVHKGRTHAYVPDFLLRLKRRDGDDVDRTLIVEVSGGMKSAHAPGLGEGESGDRPPLVVRRRQQPRRLRPLGLRGTHRHHHRQRGPPRGHRLPVRRRPDHRRPRPARLLRGEPWLVGPLPPKVRPRSRAPSTRTNARTSRPRTPPRTSSPPRSRRCGRSPTTATPPSTRN